MDEATTGVICRLWGCLSTCLAVLGCDTVENNWLHYNVSAIRKIRKVTCERTLSGTKNKTPLQSLPMCCLYYPHDTHLFKNVLILLTSNGNILYLCRQEWQAAIPLWQLFFMLNKKCLTRIYAMYFYFYFLQCGYNDDLFKVQTYM